MLSSEAHPTLPDTSPMGPDPALALQIMEWMAEISLEEEEVSIVLPKLSRMIRVLLDHIAQMEPLHFSTMFSLVAYMGHKYQLPRTTLQQLHLYRKGLAEVDQALQPSNALLLKTAQYAYGALAAIIHDLFQVRLDAEVTTTLHRLPKMVTSAAEITQFAPLVPVRVYKVDGEEWVLHAYLEEDPAREIQIKANVSDRNEDFNTLITRLATDHILPMRVQLVDCEIDDQGIYTPRGFLLEPDHLFDVTAIAECFTPIGDFPVLGILKKFLPSSNTPAMMVGNIANYFLDLLMHKPTLSFDEAFQGVFQMQPLVFATMNDEQVKDLLAQCRLHFSTLKHMVTDGFENQGITIADSFLEPSFFNPDYGIQGRLDILFVPQDRNKAPAIIELKSGMPFRENAYGLNANHYIQTLLYDLLVRDLRPGKHSLTYILYSKLTDRALRFAPVVRSRQIDALRVRNELFLWEKSLLALDPNDATTWQCLDSISDKTYPELFGFNQRDIKTFQETWVGLTEIEKAYFVAFTSFSIREHHIAKTGSGSGQRLDGQAAFWLSNRDDKIDQFAILSFLTLAQDRSHLSDPEIELSFTLKTPELVNFRNGDLAVFYPHTGKPSATQEQIWKCTIIELATHSVTIRLRAPQFNKSLFKKYPYWHLERDFLDSSFLQLTRNLFAFAAAPTSKRQLILGQRPPMPSVRISPALPDILTIEQKHVIQGILSSKEYYLLWGPPGTGKTSLVLKHLVGYLHDCTEETVLLLAYTNRAVDEICAAIEDLGPSYSNVYFRIGSRYSTAPNFRNKLLDLALSNCKDRASVSALLNSRRILIGTLASVIGKMELFQLRKFDRVIIDEASQILEPMLSGFLCQFPHFTLIGDHKQLPAVVVQRMTYRNINHAGLQDLGLNDGGQSLFERLYHRAKKMDWQHALGMLSAQGRMHDALMAFPNNHFYEGQLQLISPYQRHVLNDVEMVDSPWNGLANIRIGFIPIRPHPEELISKTNEAEAQVLIELVSYYMALYQQMNKPWQPDTLGIITPFRAQIAMIRQKFNQAGIDPSSITIDTVERYQGGARDIILISWCIQRKEELTMIRSGDVELDRKLNVALTRARNRLICLGYPPAFQGDELYQSFIDQYSLSVTEFPSIYVSED